MKEAGMTTSPPGPGITEVNQAASLEVALKQDIKLLPSQRVKWMGHHKVIQFRIPVTRSL